MTTNSNNQPFATNSIPDTVCPCCGGTQEVVVSQDGTYDGVWSAPAPCPACTCRLCNAEGVLRSRAPHSMFVHEVPCPRCSPQ